MRQNDSVQKKKKGAAEERQKVNTIFFLQSLSFCNYQINFGWWRVEGPTAKLVKSEAFLHQECFHMGLMVDRGM